MMTGNGKKPNFDSMGSDYPSGDEKTYQNRKKFNSPVHPNSNAAKTKRGTSDGYMPEAFSSKKAEDDARSKQGNLSKYVDRTLGKKK